MAKKKLKYKVGNEVLVRGIVIRADSDDSNLTYFLDIPGSHCYWFRESDLIPVPKRKAKSNG